MTRLTRSEMDRLNRLAAALRRSLSARISTRRTSRQDAPADAPAIDRTGAFLLLLCASPAVLRTKPPLSPVVGAPLHVLVCPPAVANTLTDRLPAPTKTARLGQVDRERRHRPATQWAISVVVTQASETDGTALLGGLGFGFVGGAVLGDLASASFQGRYFYCDAGPRISQTGAILGGTGTAPR